MSRVGAAVGLACPVQAPATRLHQDIDRCRLGHMGTQRREEFGGDFTHLDFGGEHAEALPSQSGSSQAHRIKKQMLCVNLLYVYVCM